MHNLPIVVVVNALIHNVAPILQWNMNNLKTMSVVCADSGCTAKKILSPSSAGRIFHVPLISRYTYHHKSTNGVEYEKWCFERFLVLEKFMIVHNHSRVIHIDADIQIMDVKLLSSMFALSHHAISAHCTHCTYFAAFNLSAVIAFNTYIQKIQDNPHLIQNYSHYSDMNALIDSKLVTHVFPQSCLRQRSQARKCALGDSALPICAIHYQGSCKKIFKSPE